MSERITRPPVEQDFAPPDRPRRPTADAPSRLPVWRWLGIALFLVAALAVGSAAQCTLAAIDPAILRALGGEAMR